MLFYHYIFLTWNFSKSFFTFPLPSRMFHQSIPFGNNQGFMSIVLQTLHPSLWKLPSIARALSIKSFTTHLFLVFLCDCKIFSTFEVGRSSKSKFELVSNRSFNTTTFANNVGESMHELSLELEICLVLEIKQLHEKVNQ